MRPRADIRAFPLERKLVLVRDDEHPVVVLNETARIIWAEIDRGADAGDVTARLAAGFGVPAARVRADVDAILAAWRSDGLLTDATRGPPAPPRKVADRPPRRYRQRPLQRAHIYALCGTPICLRFERPEVESVVHPLLAHSEVEPEQVDHVIDLLTDGSEHVIGDNGREIGRTSSGEEAVGLVINRILDLSYPDADWLALMHAAVVADQRGGAIVMAAAPGRGKSTLTAALTHAGFQYFSDDVAPLDRRTMRIRPVPYALSIKQGSWPLLRRYFPELPSLPVHIGDGQARRYLPPPGWRRAPSAGLPVRYLLFPRYRPDRSSGLQQLSTLEALERLVEARCWISLDGHNFADMLRWIDRLRRYSVDYTTLEEGVSFVVKLIASDSEHA